MSLRWKWSKPANLTVNGPVKFAVEKRKLFVIDEDGKEHEMEIVKKVLRQPAETPKQWGPNLMPIAKTVTGKSFEYSGSLATGLTIFFKPPHKRKIPVETINIIRQEITKRSPVLMGANRQPLVADSVGETLALKHNESPQVMSYVSAAVDRRRVLHGRRRQAVHHPQGLSSPLPRPTPRAPRAPTRTRTPGV
jgi:hypothetical protein